MREREKAHSGAIFNTAAADAANFVRENGGWRGRSLRHPFLNGAHAARNKRKLRDHRPPGQKKSVSPSLSSPPIAPSLLRSSPTSAIQNEVGFIMARQETNLSQLQCRPCSAAGKKEYSRKRPMQSVRQSRLLFQCDTKLIGQGRVLN